MFKSPQSAYYNLSLGAYGQVDIGALQGAGTVSAAVTWDGIVDGKQRTALTNLTITGGPVVVGQTLNIAGTTSYNGLYPVIKVLSSTSVIIDVTYVANESGTWNQLGAKGFFAGFMPMTTLIAGDVTSMSFVDAKYQIGDPTAVAYIAGVFYPFAGIITDIVLSSGDIRLMRFSHNEPQV
jgi:hypothetical protein